MAQAQNQPNPKQQPAEQQPGIANQRKDPSDWVTGNEPMTGAQASYMKTLCEQTGETFDASMTKAQASQRIDALRHQSGLADNEPGNQTP